MHYHTKSPVLFLIFNRPDVTLRVFEKIKQAQPPRIYIAADGPRPERNEQILCNQARAVIEKIDWDCEVKTLFRDANLGCKYAVSTAITWFFDQEEEGIVLEDDCLPSNDFFRFCDQLLHKYRYDTRIRHIGGSNLQMGQKWGNSSYYFSNSTHVWGWATWRRVWQDYDVDLRCYKSEEVPVQLRKIFDEELLVEDWTRIFNQLKENTINTWDYQLSFINFFHNGLCIIPNVNLISNIGFRPDGTHTLYPDDPNANIPVEKLPDIISHPKYFLAEKQADLFTWHRDFDIQKRKAILKKKRFNNWIKGFFVSQ